MAAFDTLRPSLKLESETTVERLVPTPTTTKLSRSLQALALIGLAAVACHRTDISAERCVVSGTPGGAVPRLYRQASWRSQRLPPIRAPMCSSETRPIEDECESVDDLSALLGTGFACGPAGQAIQRVCPSFGDRVREIPAAVSDRPCGAAACPNRQLEVREESGSLTRILFYDDPSCHSAAPDAKCPNAAHACYYRVLAVSTELAGEEN
jgi:hypothetical protein